jgi:hypothetical protein
MRDIQMTMRDWISDPDAAEKSLLELSGRIEDGFKIGRIEDFHFFLLDRQVKENLREIRQSKIRFGFKSLPEELKRKMNTVLEDGRITDKEYKKFVTTITDREDVSENDKDKLRQLMRNWKNIDTAEAPKKVVMKKVAVHRKKMATKLEADKLGWEDLRKESKKGKKSSAAELGWEELKQPSKKPKKVGKFRAAQLGWEDLEKDTIDYTDDKYDDFDTEFGGL